MILAPRSHAQEPGPMPNPQAMQMQVQQIMQQRPREAEAAARAFLHVIATQTNQGPVEPQLAALDSLKGATPDVYWSEVAQLTVQFDAVQKLTQRDSGRAALVTQMFGTEVQARALQRAYRGATEARRQAIRTQIEAQITKHFELEDRLRRLEIADIERRLAEVRAETARRVEKRSEFVKWTVDDILRDAVRPQ
ncbi:MAG: hypothetical protein ACREMI_08170 [Gemmatimonadales bacterium]